MGPPGLAKPPENRKLLLPRLTKSGSLAVRTVFEEAMADGR